MLENITFAGWIEWLSYAVITAFFGLGVLFLLGLLWGVAVEGEDD